VTTTRRSSRTHRATSTELPATEFNGFDDLISMTGADNSGDFFFVDVLAPMAGKRKDRADQRTETLRYLHNLTSNNLAFKTLPRLSLIRQTTTVN
jgi:hypothetical protein